MSAPGWYCGHLSVTSNFALAWLCLHWPHLPSWVLACLLGCLRGSQLLWGLLYTWMAFWTSQCHLEVCTCIAVFTLTTPGPTILRAWLSAWWSRNRWFLWGLPYTWVATLPGWEVFSFFEACSILRFHLKVCSAIVCSVCSNQLCSWVAEWTSTLLCSSGWTSTHLLVSSNFAFLSCWLWTTWSLKVSLLLYTLMFLHWSLVHSAAKPSASAHIWLEMIVDSSPASHLFALSICMIQTPSKDSWHSHSHPLTCQSQSAFTPNRISGEVGRLWVGFSTYYFVQILLNEFGLLVLEKFHYWQDRAHQSRIQILGSPPSSPTTLTRYISQESRNQIRDCLIWSGGPQLCEISIDCENTRGGDQFQDFLACKWIYLYFYFYFASL